MDPNRNIPKKFTKKFGNKVINRQYFRRKTGLYIRQFLRATNGGQSITYQAVIKKSSVNS